VRSENPSPNATFVGKAGLSTTADLVESPGPSVPWGPRSVGNGVSSLVALQLLIGLIAAVLMSALSIESMDTVRGARLGLAASALYDAGLVALVIAWTRLGPRKLFAAVGFTPLREAQLWLPTATAALCYAFVVCFALAMRTLGLDALVPSNSVPEAITSDVATTAFAAIVICLAAPVSEEFFYRGFLVGGLARWGRWLALPLPGILFGAVHLDLGSMVPYSAIGIVLGWLYWRRARLIDAIVFHVLFNSTSFAILVLQS
jgi:membrane protease YdiL (CAAX protease family)